MSEMTMIEVVARKIYAAAFVPGAPTPGPGWSWEHAGKQQQAFAIKQAVAALTALLTPSEGMVMAGEMAVIDGGRPDFVGDDHGSTMSARMTAAETTKTFKAMISQALDEVA